MYINVLETATRLVRATAMASALAAIGVAAASTAHAGPLMDRIKNGESIRLGYTAAAAPACFPGENGQATGITYDLTIGVLKEMGHDNVESVAVADFGSLIPGLAAKRFDIALCGMYIRADRCKNVAFSNPQAAVSDLFVLPKGNPQHIKTWDDVLKSGSQLVYVQATATRDDALKAGLDESRLVAVPSSTELAAAIISGRVGIGHLFAWDAGAHAKAHPDKLELVDPGIADKVNWSSNAYSHDDADFVAAYNEAQTKFMKTDEYLAVLKKYGLDESSIPDPTLTADWVCQNR